MNLMRVMIIRTPRRRVSPRTKLKYRAIKNFFRKVKGTSSGNNNTNSSIEVSVSDLQTKIEGIEQELNRVNKHCQDLSSFQSNLARESEDIVLRDDRATKNYSTSHKNVKDVETKVLYKSSSRQFCKTDGSNDTVNCSSHDRKNKMNAKHTNQNFDLPSKIKNSTYGKFNDRNECFTERQRRPKSNFKTAPSDYSTSSFHSLIEPKNKHYAQPGYSEQRQRRIHNTERIRSASPRRSQSPNKGVRKNDVTYKQRHNERSKRDYPELDKVFIDKIIKKQYKPVKIFGTRDSDFSQFSAPVCRDQEVVIRDNIEEGSELCSCCLSGNRRYKHHYVCHNDISDMKSICDTRLYSSKRHRHHRIPRYYKDDYNNSNFYDIIPVKEKSSPKSRRKFIEDNAISYQHCREVPPSPRSHRPRLNLKAQNYTEYEEDLRCNSRKTHQFQENQRETYVTDLSDTGSVQKRENGTLKTIRAQNITPLQDNKEIISNLLSPTFVNEQTNMSYNDTTLNTQATDITVDKTDKALGEIKDILQSFLLEIKKESIHSEKSNITSKLGEKSFNNAVENDKVNNIAMPNSGHNFNMGQCNVSPFLPSFANPCCYPLFPMYPINCMQNGYIMPSPSFTCTACAKNSLPNTCANQDNSNYGKENQNKENLSHEINTTNETQELIKEIYKFVSQNPKTPRKFDTNNRNDVDHPKSERRINKILLTNRSVGSSSKHDANVGTNNLRRCSKSCEAISSRVNSDTYRTTNASHSDTVLDKLSLKASESSTESNASSDAIEKKSRRNKFQKLLKSLRLFKKKRKDIIEEVSESESTIEDNVTQKSKPPFMQHITNYALHGQEFFHPPPILEHSCNPHSKHRHNHDFYHQPFHPEMYQQHKHAPRQMPYDHRNPPNYNPLAYPSCPNYDPYNQIPPQVPLCLKEIEVKSIATQSEKKMSLFKKFAKNPQPNPQNTPSPLVKNNKPSFWDSLQEKTKQRVNPDPMDFSLKTQKQLAQGDMKLRNAMLKKLFYKRNPFSPGNLIIRTLLGKDKSSFGDPPKMYKPRMFL